MVLHLKLSCLIHSGTPNCSSNKYFLKSFCSCICSFVLQKVFESLLCISHCVGHTEHINEEDLRWPPSAWSLQSNMGSSTSDRYAHVMNVIKDKRAWRRLWKTKENWNESLYNSSFWSERQRKNSHEEVTRKLRSGEWVRVS